MRGLLILPCVALLACAYTPRPPQPYTSYIPEMGRRRAVAWSDGTILLHPTHFVLTGVVNVEPNYALKLRAGPGTRFNVVAAIPADATGILAFDKDAVWDGDTWWYPVEWQDFRGYVSGDYLRTLSSRESSGRGNSRFFAVTFDLVPNTLCVSKANTITRDRSLVPILDLSRTTSRSSATDFSPLSVS
jgi:hypothetical protein